MALVQCKYCGKDVSDKAKNCPHCGESLVETVLDGEETVTPPTICEECNTMIPQGAEVCPNCGCPVTEKAAKEVTQKVEVTAVNLQVKKSTKKRVIIALAIVAVLAITGVIGYSVHKENLAKEAAQISANYAANMEMISYTMLMGAIDAEDAGNIIKQVWYNAIYEERDSATDKYTRPSGYWVDDFNEALGNLFSDKTFTSQIADIEENQDTVAALMKQLKNPPEEHEEAYDAIKEYYDAYIELTNLAVNPTGSLQTFSNSFNEADTNVLNCYNAVKLYIED